MDQNPDSYKNVRIEQVESRLSQIESNIEHLFSLLTPMALIERHLGGVEIPSEGTGKEDVAVVDEHPRARRNFASNRGLTTSATKLTRNFRPSAFGYTAEDFKQDYPDLNPVDVLESFLSWYIANGRTSYNWVEQFFSYANKAVEIQREKPKQKVETDSMGLPTDRKLRRQMTGQEQLREDNN